MNSNKFTDGRPDWKQGRGRRFWIKIPFLIAMVVVIKSALVLWFWNELIPDLFHGPVINFWQACGLTILVKLLVSGGMKPFGMHRGGHFGRHFRGGDDDHFREHFKAHFKEHFEKFASDPSEKKSE